MAAAVVTAERAAYARYKQQLLVSTAALGGTLSVVGFATYSKVLPSFLRFIDPFFPCSLLLESVCRGPVRSAVRA